MTIIGKMIFVRIFILSYILAELSKFLQVTKKRQLLGLSFFVS